LMVFVSSNALMVFMVFRQRFDGICVRLKQQASLMVFVSGLSNALMVFMVFRQRFDGICVRRKQRF